MSHVTYLSQSNIKLICIFKITMKLLPPKKDRIKGHSYLYQGNIRIWDGKELKCEHNRKMSRCIKCGGKEICEHKKRRSACKICGGSEICEHQRIRSKCIECNGTSICMHNRQRSQCKDCNGPSICEHKKQRSTCIECNGTNICMHKKIRSHCKDCNGSGICKHNRERSKCIDCNGSQICKHKKQKSQCKECGGSSLCRSSWCETYGNKKYEGYCLSCFVNNPENAGKTVVRNYKTKELYVVDHIKKVFPNHQWINDKIINGGCSKRRPDLMIDLLTHVIIVEIDENQHEDYDTMCNNMRTMQLSQDNAHRPTIFIRFNPDGYTKDGKKISSCFHLNNLGVCVVSKKQTHQWKQRLEELEKTIEKYLVFNEEYKTIERINLFYDK